MPTASLTPAPALWHLGALTAQSDRLVLHLEPRRRAVRCPQCRTKSRRVHSRYQRRPADLPWAGWPVQLVIQARRFFCDLPTCPRRIFTERFPAVLPRYARRTERARRALLELCHSSNGELAAQVAALLGFPISPDTLLRLQRREVIAVPAPRVVGVDEFALRRGRTYGTLVVDLEQRRPVALLPDARASPLAAWLRQHPQVTVLARDRAEAYARAGRDAAPQATQVADRFHLVRNVIEALRAVLYSRRWELPAPEQPPGAGPPQPAATLARQPTPRKQAAWAAVQQRYRQGHSLRSIARELGLSRQTVRKYARAERVPLAAVRARRASKLDPYLPYLHQRWSAGCHNAHQLYRELVQRGYRGAVSMVRAAVQPWRRTLAPPPPQRAPSLPRLLLWSARRLTEPEQATLAPILDRNPLLAEGYQLKERFQVLVAQREVAALEGWLAAAAASRTPLSAWPSSV